MQVTQYDPRLGRRWNIDPVIYPSQSPYACFDNNPIYFNDPSGAQGEPTPKKGEPILDENGKQVGTTSCDVVTTYSQITENKAQKATSYSKDGPSAVYPKENPYGPNGQFRTINTEYNLNVIVIVPAARK